MILTASIKIGGNVYTRKFTINLYKAIDTNNNGIPDLDASNGFLYSPILYTADITTQDNTSNIDINIQTEYMFPTEIATYKINIQNKGVRKNYVRFVFEGHDTNNYSFYLSAFSVRVVAVNGTDIIKYDKYYFADYLTDNTFEPLTLVNDLIIDGMDSDEPERDFWFQLEFESYNDLLANVDGIGAIFPSQDDYQNINALTLPLPILRIYIET